MTPYRSRLVVDGGERVPRLMPTSSGAVELVDMSGTRLGNIDVSASGAAEVEVFRGVSGVAVIATLPGKVRCLCFPGSSAVLDGAAIELHASGDVGAQPSENPNSSSLPARHSRQSITTQAAIMAGGLATRLEPISGRRTGRSKPDVPIAKEVSLIRCIAESLVAIGIKNIFVNTHFAPGCLRAGLKMVDARFDFLHESEPSGTAGPIVKALHGRAYSSFDQRKPLLIMQGDALCDLDLRGLLEAHASRNYAGVTIGVQSVGVEEVHKYGIVSIERAEDDGTSAPVTGFMEKPTAEQAGDRRLASTGIYVVGAGLYPWVAESHRRKSEKEGSMRAASSSTELDFARDVFPIVLESRHPTRAAAQWPPGASIYAARVPGYWNDIGSPDQYFRGIQDVVSGRVRLAGDPEPLEMDRSGTIYWKGGRQALNEAHGIVQGRAIVMSVGSE